MLSTGLAHATLVSIVNGRHNVRSIVVRQNFRCDETTVFREAFIIYSNARQWHQIRCWLNQLSIDEWDRCLSYILVNVCRLELNILIIPNIRYRFNIRFRWDARFFENKWDAIFRIASVPEAIL